MLKVLISIFCLICFTAHAQTKIGYVCRDTLFDSLIETKIAYIKIGCFQDSLETVYRNMLDKVMYGTCKLGVIKETEGNEKKSHVVDSLNAFLDKWSDLVIKYSEYVFSPVIKKVNDAIKAVATEHGYSYVIDCDYKDFEAIKPNAEDVTIWVREKLDLR